MIDILFIGISNYQDPFVFDWFADFRYAISFLRQNGVRAELVSLAGMGNKKDLLELIKNSDPLLIFMDLGDENCREVEMMIRDLKKNKIRAKIVLGGISATALPQEVLTQYPGIDYLIRGEREMALLELIKKFKRGLRPKQGTQLIGPPLQDLDQLGKMVLDELKEPLTGQAGRNRVGYIITSRGCYGNCSFCGVPQLYQQKTIAAWRGRSPKVVVDEIEQLHRRLALRYFVFQDDNYFGPGQVGQARAVAIAREIMVRKLKIKYFVCGRLNDLVVSTLKIMKKSGLARLGVSIESVSQPALTLFRKGLRAKDIWPTLEKLEKLKIQTEVNLIFFNPYMSLSEVRDNLKFIKSLKRKKYLQYSSAFPFNELKPFAWAPITAQLKRDKLITGEKGICRYRDPAVGKIVLLIRDFKKNSGMIFKFRMMFEKANKLSVKAKTDPAMYHDLEEMSFRIKYWLGMEYLPSYLEQACRILEGQRQGQEEEFKRLRRKFQKEISKIRVIFEKMLAKRAISGGIHKR